MRKLLVAGIAAMSMLAACAPAPDLSALEDRVSAVEAEADQIAALQTRLETLEARLAGLETAAEPADDAHAASPFEVAVAQYVMDNAGFHEIAEALAETKQVDPQYLSAVNRARAVLASAPWPEELAEQGQAFVVLLDDLAHALEADDGEAAAELADQTHEAQHELSHALADWLGAAGDGH